MYVFFLRSWRQHYMTLSKHREPYSWIQDGRFS